MTKFYQNRRIQPTVHREGLLLRIALLADFAFLLGLHTALVFAFLARGLCFVAARFRAHDSHAAKENDCAEDCTDGLHVFCLSGRPTSSVERFICCLFRSTTQVTKATQPYPQSGVITGGL